MPQTEVLGDTNGCLDDAPDENNGKGGRLERGIFLSLPFSGVVGTTRCLSSIVARNLR